MFDKKKTAERYKKRSKIIITKKKKKLKFLSHEGIMLTRGNGRVKELNEP